MTNIKAIVKAGTAVAKSDWQKTATSYRVTLKYKGKQMSVDFWFGKLYGIPTAFDVMYYLCEDACWFDECFEKWADNYGYDQDSREAERIHKAVKSHTKRLKNLLGDDFESVIYMEEDELKAWCEQEYPEESLK